MRKRAKLGAWIAWRAAPTAARLPNQLALRDWVSHLWEVLQRSLPSCKGNLGYDLQPTLKNLFNAVNLVLEPNVEISRARRFHF